MPDAPKPTEPTPPPQIKDRNDVDRHEELLLQEVTTLLVSTASFRASRTRQSAGR